MLSLATIAVGVWVTVLGRRVRSRARVRVGARVRVAVKVRVNEGKHCFGHACSGGTSGSGLCASKSQYAVQKMVPFWWIVAESILV